MSVANVTELLGFDLIKSCIHTLIIIPGTHYGASIVIT